MEAYISMDGALVLEPESLTETYALSQMLENSEEEGIDIVISELEEEDDLAADSALFDNDDFAVDLEFDPSFLADDELRMDGS